MTERLRQMLEQLIAAATTRDDRVCLPIQQWGAFVLAVKDEPRGEPQ